MCVHAADNYTNVAEERFREVCTPSSSMTVFVSLFDVRTTLYVRDSGMYVSTVLR